MAYRIFCERLLRGTPITIYGDGHQSRSNTYIDDCVAATVRAATRPGGGDVRNIGGGTEIELLDALAILAEALEVTPVVEHLLARPGDQRRTVADTRRARQVLAWAPRVTPEVGLRREAEWVRAPDRRFRSLLTRTGPPRPALGPRVSDTAPTIGPPMGVLPRDTMA